LDPTSVSAAALTVNVLPASSAEPSMLSEAATTVASLVVRL
jgi:hypothetical protein